MRLILASASARRAEILRAAGFDFTVLPSAIDEAPLPGETPEDLVQRLAGAKAERAAAREKTPVIVIGADTEVVLDGTVLGKPRSDDDARQMLTRLAGRMHSVITGVMLIRVPDGERCSFVASTQVEFAKISPDEIRRYVATAEPFDKAGGYAIQGRAGCYIPRVEGCYFNIVGLPLARLYQALLKLGWPEG
jgi:septum formation protein